MRLNLADAERSIARGDPNAKHGGDPATAQQSLRHERLRKTSASRQGSTRTNQGASHCIWSGHFVRTRFRRLRGPTFQAPEWHGAEG